MHCFTFIFLETEHKLCVLFSENFVHWIVSEDKSSDSRPIVNLLGLVFTGRLAWFMLQGHANFVNCTVSGGMLSLNFQRSRFEPFLNYKTNSSFPFNFMENKICIESIRFPQRGRLFVVFNDATKEIMITDSQITESSIVVQMGNLDKEVGFRHACVNKISIENSDIVDTAIHIASLSPSTLGHVTLRNVGVVGSFVRVEPGAIGPVGMLIENCTFTAGGYDVSILNLCATHVTIRECNFNIRSNQGDGCVITVRQAGGFLLFTALSNLAERISCSVGRCDKETVLLIENTIIEGATESSSVLCCDGMFMVITNCKIKVKVTSYRAAAAAAVAAVEESHH